MKMTRALYLLRPAALFTACCLAACGGTADSDSPETDATVGRTEVLNKVVLPTGVELEFFRVEVDGPAGKEWAMVRSDLVPAGAADAVSELVKQSGPLTMLETFQAFAPEGAVPHGALSASHESEVRALKRTDASVKNVRAIAPQAAAAAASLEDQCAGRVVPSPANFLVTKGSATPTGASAAAHICANVFGGGAKPSALSNPAECARGLTELRAGVCNTNSDAASIKVRSWITTSDTAATGSVQTTVAAGASFGYTLAASATRRGFGAEATVTSGKKVFLAAGVKLF